MEQEVTGDNTLALDSVLEYDTERVQLLAREGELLHGRRGQEHSSRQVCVPWGGGVLSTVKLQIIMKKSYFNYEISIQL